MTVQTRRVELKSKSKISSLRPQFQDQGFVLLRAVIDTAFIDELLADFAALVNTTTGKRFTDAHSPELAQFFDANPVIETQVYDQIRHQSWVHEFVVQDALANPAKELLGENIGAFTKAPFRIDMPLWTKDLALWHQDHFYVRGNTDIITAWVPMQDVNYVNGCLSIMPRSHLMGPLPHDLPIGRKFVPSNIFDNEIRMVPMNKGDVLLFSSLLLHNGNMNYSQIIRYSMQPRYTPLELPTDPGMGDVIPL